MQSPQKQTGSIHNTHLSQTKTNAYLGFEGAVLKLVAALDGEGGGEAGGGTDVNGLGVGKAAAAKGVLVQKIALFPRHLDAAAALFDEECVLSTKYQRDNAVAQRRSRKGKDWQRRGSDRT
jgi:hypothetical protein